MRIDRKRNSLSGQDIRRLYYYVQALFFILLSTYAGAAPPAGKHFDFNPACQEAYRAITQLRLAEGQKMLDAEKRRDPGNLIPAYLENYIDFFVLFFNEDPAQYEVRRKMLDKRIELMSEGPEDSPFNLFTRAVIHFQWAAIKIKFGSNWDAGWEFRRSFLQAREVQKKFPSFQPAQMLSGAMQVVAGTIPDGYKWLSGLLGIKGNITGGMKSLDGALNSGDRWAVLYHEEAVFYYLYLTFYIENKHEEVFTYIHRNKMDVVNNRLYTYLQANLALNDQQAGLAEQTLRQRNMGENYLDMPVWDLEMGYARMYHLETDAHVYLERFVTAFKGKFYVKDALLKIGWCYYLQGRDAEAARYRELVLTRGAADADADKQAVKEAKSGRWPDKTLLKARLLSDGGYYDEALQLLSGHKAGDFGRPEERCEYLYRLGRIYDGLGRQHEAVAAYEETYRSGSRLREYYAARAALQTGYIFEQRGDKAGALVWFQRCLDLPDHDYKNSLDQKAKAGVGRCKGQ